MSYDLDQLAQKYSLQVASIAFATTTNLGGTTLIASPGANAAIVIHGVWFQASAWAQAAIEKATTGSTYWTGYAGQAPIYEPTRIVCDAGASIVVEANTIATNAGSGVLKVWFSIQQAAGGKSL
jgi:hypothetical protein